MLAGPSPPCSEARSNLRHLLPAHTAGFFLLIRRHPPKPVVGASLLAIAVDQLVVMLDVPPPSRASSLPHWVLGWPQISHPPPIPCGSELARDSGGSASGDVGCAAAFASKPAPTLGSRLAADFTSARNPLWEQSLLAIAVDQLVVMLAVPPPSRASPLPHWVLGWPQISPPPATRCGSKACSR